MKKNTQRFSDRVEDYVKYRPHYPKQIIDLLIDAQVLNKNKIIADIGSGTGISCLPFLQNDNKVFGVEPNQEMREASEHIFSEYENFESINGTAENTTLQNNSIDIIFCGQAFHWFDRTLCKKEFNRILKKDGNIILAWNSRSTKSEFQKAYEKTLLKNIKAYQFVNHRNISDKEIASFCLPKKLNILSLKNQQIFDLESLKGRLLSSSYSPKEGQEYDNLMVKIEALFEQYQNDNKVIFEYETKIYWS